MNADALRVMYQLDPNLSPQEIRDILWLATVLETRASGQSPESGDDASEPLPSTPNGLPDIVSPDNSVPSGRSESTIDTDHQRTADLYQSGADGSFSTAGRGQATLRTPAAVALPAAQGIARAMRPLMRRIPSRVQVIQDTDATVRRIADTGIWVPVLRPARARWFDVALVIDESQPMLVWQDTIRELQRLLERHGAFRTVRIWRLRVDSDGALTIRMGRDPVPRPAHALLDSTHRQLIVIASNCLSAPWYDGQMPALIQAWSQINPVALIQLLPQTLWRRTALRTARLAQFHAPAPAIPNQHYQWRPR